MLRNSTVRLTDHPDLTIAVYLGCKATKQQQQPNFSPDFAYKLSVFMSLSQSGEGHIVLPLSICL